jgi:hypothetical protein
MVVKNSPLRHKPLNRDDDLVTNSSYPQGYPPSWWIQECKGNIFRFEAAIVLGDPAPPTRARLATRGPPSYADGFVRGLLVKSRSHVGREHTLAYPLDRAERVNRRRLDLIGEGQHVFGKPRIDGVIWGKPSIGAPRFRRAQQAADGFKKSGNSWERWRCTAKATGHPLTSESPNCSLGRDEMGARTYV